MFYDLFDDFFGGFDKDLHLVFGTPKAQYNDEMCPVCKTRLSEVAKTGKAGCSKCYTVFRPQLEYMLGRIHSNTKHAGKVSESAGERIKVKKELEKLQKDLQTAIAKQDFEQAAVLRDQIKALHDKEVG
ncbi:MAG: UvrB/UvrC motif-containing protein [Peptococcaceae bacterium]|nr:UvrB/UvrC motif-containing protein [Clostridia bacterium]MBQ7025864.1 UvrB/UvrC motif-containing protein [Peptococcaceae bacterium]